MEDRRKRRRFPVHKPAIIVVKGRPRAHEIRGTTENVSELGALVLTDFPLPKGTAVELILTLEEQGFTGLRLSCPGQVVRTESTEMGNVIAIAIQCRQALTEYASVNQIGIT